MKIILIISVILATAFCQDTSYDNCGGFTEEFGYVTVRPYSHMFYVTYHADGSGNSTDYPLILWLQGGPGESSTGFGNFWEIGPCDIYGEVREHRWTQKANMMFVDSPVGSGFSYVEKKNTLTTTNAEAATDLVSFMKEVYQIHPQYENMPFFIYSQGYGAKVGVEFALQLLSAIDHNEINCDFQGMVLGTAWISPIDYINTWGSYLYSMGFVNEAELANIDAAAALTQTAVDDEEWCDAVSAERNSLDALREGTLVEFYNIHAFDETLYVPPLGDRTGEDSIKIRPKVGNYYGEGSNLELYMNGVQKNKWNIPNNVVWNGQFYDTFFAHECDFMKPVVTSVVEIIDMNRIHVAVSNGNLDLYTNIQGQLRWINNMNFSGKDEFQNTSRVDMHVAEYSNIAWYSQRSGTFSINTFLRAGHYIAIDAPAAALQLIDFVTQWGAEAANA